jgi:hypothetical protein
VPRSGGVPKAEVWIDSELVGLTAFEVIEALETGEPAIFDSQGNAPRGGLVINPMTLADGEERIVAERIAAVVRAGG